MQSQLREIHAKLGRTPQLTMGNYQDVISSYKKSALQLVEVVFQLTKLVGELRSTPPQSVTVTVEQPAKESE